jgi:hypothetical protein
LRPVFNVLFVAHIEINQIRLDQWCSIGVYTNEKAAYSKLYKVQSLGYQGTIEVDWVTREEYQEIKEQENA